MAASIDSHAAKVALASRLRFAAALPAAALAAAGSRRAQTGIESALTLPLPVAPGRAFAAVFMPAGADDAFAIGLHPPLQDGLGHAAPDVTLIVLLPDTRTGPMAFPWRDPASRWPPGVTPPTAMNPHQPREGQRHGRSVTFRNPRWRRTSDTSVGHIVRS
jgi:hypothetical protein